MSKFEKNTQLQDWLGIKPLEGQVIESKGVQELPEHIRNEVYSIVSEFYLMPGINETLSEHHAGVFTAFWHRIYWQVECFNNSLVGSSLGLCNQIFGKRVLTVRTAIERLAELNDDFRHNVSDTELNMSPEISQLSKMARDKICSAVRIFEDFPMENDSHPEHDFGVLTVLGQRVNWQIDCLNKEQAGHSSDPCDPAVTQRVMTIKTAAETIAHLNDEFRIDAVGWLMVKNRIVYIGHQNKLAVMQAVREFSEFGERNDPNKEHDFGAVTVNGQNVYWKIDYYDPELKYKSDEPCDALVTERVLTLLPE